MKKSIYIVVYLLIVPFLAFSQIQTDTDDNPEVPQITFLKFQRSKFILLDQDKFAIKRGLKKNDMEAILDGNSEAIKHYNTFRTLRPIKITTRFVGLAGIVVGLALVPEYGDTGWIVYGSSLGMLLAVHLPIAITAGSQAGKAVDEHNTIMSKNKEKYSLNMGITGNGVGLVLNF